MPLLETVGRRPGSLAKSYAFPMRLVSIYNERQSIRRLVFYP